MLVPMPTDELFIAEPAEETTYLLGHMIVVHL